MARGLNVVHLIGNVGADPEVRTTPGSTKVANLSLATSRSWTDAQGNKQEKTEWHRLVVWGDKSGGGLAKVVEQYVNKGDKLYVSGRIEYRQWTDKDNQVRYSTEINVSELLLIGGKGVAPSSAPTASATRDAKRAQRDTAKVPPTDAEDDDSDLPF